MAGSLNEIKLRIASTKKTSQITGAMQMVSASKLAKSEQLAKSFQIYASKVRAITTDLLRGELMTSDTSNPMLIRRPIQKVGYIVITSDAADGLVLLSQGAGTEADAYVNENEAPEFAVDGDVSTKWCATGAAPHEITLDLGEVNTVSAVDSIREVVKRLL